MLKPNAIMSRKSKTTQTSQNQYICIMQQPTLLPQRLSVLPGRHITLIRQSQSREPQTISNVAQRNGRIADGGKHLPALVGGRAGHEPAGATAVEGVVRPGGTRLVGQVADRGTWGDIGGVSLGEAQGAGGVDVDLLAAGDFNILLWW